MNLDLYLDQPLNDLKCKVAAIGDLLECPVCFEQLSGHVLQCTQGHHLCRNCQNRLSQCPFCKCKFNGTRNYFVENVITLFEEAKASLVILDNALHVSQEKTELWVIGEGSFPCAKEDCRVSLSYYDMIRHIKVAHKKNLIDVGPIKSDVYTHSWCLEHERFTYYDFILYIHNMGIFFIKIDSSHRGNVYGYVEIVNSIAYAKQFYYTLRIGDKDKHFKVFHGQVVSTTDTHKKTIYEHIDYLLRPDGSGTKKLFDCNLTIAYRNLPIIEKIEK